MIVALAFVPIPNLDDAFEALNSNLPGEYQEQLQFVMDWFEDFYLGRMGRRQRRRARFPPEIW